MMRVRENGWVVPRHNAGMLRIVRGSFYLADKHIPEINRTTRAAAFHVDNGPRLELFDAVLIRATPDMMILNGFERDDNGVRVVDYAQTWVLAECKGETPEPTRGPPFPR